MVLWGKNISIQKIILAAFLKNGHHLAIHIHWACACLYKQEADCVFWLVGCLLTENTRRGNLTALHRVLLDNAFSVTLLCKALVHNA